MSDNRPATVVVLEHTPGAGVSAFAETLDARAHVVPWRRIQVPEHAPLPAVDGQLAGLVVMGGIMSAVDPDAHPWMGPELELLHQAVDAGVPVLGVCLGAQLLGQALGGMVERRNQPEAAYVPLARTSAGRDDAVVAGWPDGAAALFIHEDEVTTLPPDAELLLEGNDGHAAWRVGSATAVQFHPEITGAQIRRWADAGLLDDLLTAAGVEPGALAAEAERRDRFVTAVGQALLGRFLDGPVQRRLRAQRG